MSTPSEVGASCGLCLRLIDSSECPAESNVAALPNCQDTHNVGDRCEADGECGTDRTANNCGAVHDIYERCVNETLTQPPRGPPDGPAPPPLPQHPPALPMPPTTPLQPCAPSVACAAGAHCGLCLRLAEASECPSDAKVALLPPCDHRLTPGAMCEAGGECGTDPTANNCAWRDLYVRETCVPRAPAASGGESAAALLPIALSSIGGAVGIALLAVACIVCLRRWQRGRVPSGIPPPSIHRHSTRTSGARGMPAEVTAAAVDSKAQAFVSQDQL